MKVLVAFEKEYRAYMAAIAAAIRMFRSNIEVALTNTDQLEAEVERFDPQLVICSSPIPSNPVAPQLMAWIELSPDPDQQSRFQVGEHSWESTNPSLSEILPAVDETQRLYRRASHEQGPIETDET
jgi:hypothetical protein